jgi:diphthamide biosynthesis protein 7
LHFHPRIPNLLGIATSAGTVSLFTVNVSDSDSDGKDTGFTHLATYSVHEDPSIPTLFLAWLPKSWLPGFGRDGFAVTFSDGRTGVFGVDSGVLVQRGTAGNENDEVTELASFNAKQPIEIWFVAAATFPYQNQDTEDKTSRKSTPYLFTGDDFGTLQTIRFPDTDPAADQESDSELDSLPPPLLNISDRALHHTAGVTSILPLPIPLDHALTSGSPLLLTGSYDEVLRVYHAAGRGRVVAEEGLGGGVWRLELLDTTTTTAGGETWTFLVLASCMHGGTRVVRVAVSAENGGEDVSAEIEILAEFTEHESMNYASGVWGLDSLDPAVEGGAEIKVVSSSFYDKRVCVWSVKV